MFSEKCPLDAHVVRVCIGEKWSAGKLSSEYPQQACEEVSFGETPVETFEFQVHRFKFIRRSFMNSAIALRQAFTEVK